MADLAVAISGTGFIARHLAMEIGRRDGYRLSHVLTRRRPDHVDGFDLDLVTDSVEVALEGADVLVECTGDAIWATDVIEAAVEAGLPVVTMNTEFHITTGSSFVGRGLVTEAAGDQPGCLAELHEDAVAMGFQPIVYGNMKGFLNENPSREDMEFWGRKQGISLEMVTSFTDGTKVQAEQILVGNHFGATIAQENMLGPACDSLSDGVEMLIAAHRQTGVPLTEYLVSRNLSHGVFIVATHDEAQSAALSYYKLGDGPYYTIIRNNIFVHLEILKTIDRIMTGGGILLDNSRRPSLGLAAVAKQPLQPGVAISPAIGSFQIRGTAVRIAERPDHVPIALLDGATVERPLEPGEVITYADVSVPDSNAQSAWTSIASQARANPQIP